MEYLFSKNVLSPKKGSLIAGYIYWPIYLFGLSLLLVTIFELCGMSLSTTKGYTILNLVYFTANFTAVLLIFFPFLRDSLKAAKGNFGQICISALLGYGLCNLLALQIDIFYKLLDIVPENMNQEAVTSLLNYAPWQMVICTVIFAPITEECLARGLLFGPFAKKVPVLGYILSCVVFAGIHVVGSIGTMDWLTILLCFVQYLPHSIALAWAYHRSGNILAPMLLHAAINLMSVIAEMGGFA